MQIKKFLIIGFPALIIFSLLKFYDEYREKDLDEVISYDPSNHQIMTLRSLDLRVDDTEKIEEFMEFLSEYRVKKMWSRDWDTNVAGLKGFLLILGGENPVTSLILEDRLNTNNGYYEVVNGPIDMEWVNNYIMEINQ